MARHGHQPQPGPRPSPPATGSGVQPPAPSPIELPLVAAPQPALCRMVIVWTPTKINGHHEHAAVITGLYQDDDVVDVTLFPSGEQPYPITQVRRIDRPIESPTTIGHLSWHWPPR